MKLMILGTLLMLSWFTLLSSGIPQLFLGAWTSPLSIAIGGIVGTLFGFGFLERRNCR